MQKDKNPSKSPNPRENRTTHEIPKAHPTQKKTTKKTVKMFNGLATKLAMKKMGIPKNALDMSALTGGSSSTEPNKLKKNPPGQEDADAANANGWPKWMTVKNLPLTAQAWLSPPPPPVPVAAECPKVGDLAPLDRDRKIEFGGGRRVLVVFLRCVGCACKCLLLFFVLLFFSTSPSFSFAITKI